MPTSKANTNLRGAGRAARWILLMVCLSECPRAIGRQQQQQQPGDLANQSLEDLMNVEVTSVSKKEQKLSKVAAAIFVITKEDIRRSGAVNIPDALRMVPGLDVAQIDANTWAISARGLNEQFSDKLLVMIDGRSVYTPTFGGVYWDSLDLPLEDIERIEVVLGPGGTVWGANAVNGVINIISKSASETRGGLVVAGGGNIDEEFGTVQYGGPAGQNTDYRAYVKYNNEDHLPGLDGKPGGDGWDMLRGGFRTDSALSTDDKLTVEGNLYGAQEGQNVLSIAPGIVNAENGNLSGGDVETFWNHTYSEKAASTLQVSFDRYERNVPFTDNRDTFDVAFQDYFSWGERQNLIWGVGYRYTSHESNSATVSYDPSDSTRQLFSAFLQDEIEVIQDQLFLTVGTKLEHNDYNGFDVLPSARLAWQPERKQTVWMAISRAERTPSSGDVADHVDSGLIPQPAGLPLRVVLSGDPNFKNEELVAYEAGYRASITNAFSLDLSAYFNSYDDLRTLETGVPSVVPAPPTTYILLPLSFANEMHGEAHGLEAAGTWKPVARWEIKGGYAFERVHMHQDPTSNDTVLLADAQGGSPHHSAQLQSHVTLGHALAWDSSAFFADRRPALGVPSHTRMDSGLSWQFAKSLSLSVVGQDLLKDHYLEYLNLSGLTQSALIKRSGYIKLTWRF
ncbi:MAG: TonB-dependent receptor [Candidatus Acidiferrum sp.]